MFPCPLIAWIQPVFSKASERQGDRSGEGLGCMRRRGVEREEEERKVERKEEV